MLQNAPSAAVSISPFTLLSGTDALIEVMLEQKRRDARSGFNTAGFVSGYRGSPLGNLDMALWAAAQRLQAADIHFNPGVNEELAATSVWGSQYVAPSPQGFKGARVDGVFSLWYGKGPGVDRSGDALKHGNLAGTSAQGGALVVAGDDHAAKSSTTAHQSEQALMAAGIPVLYPSDVADIVHLGLHGIAMSRFSGCWVGLKVVTDVIETTQTVHLAAAGPQAQPAVGVAERACRIQDPPRLAEERLFRHKLPAVLDYARQHGLNATVIRPARATVGVVAAGKSFADVRQAFVLLGLTEGECERLGIRVLKLDMVWPLDPVGMATFAQGLKSVLVVEEKRPFVEDQFKALLHDLADQAPTPRVWGKKKAASVLDPGAPRLLPDWGELNPVAIAQVMAIWLQQEAGITVAMPDAPVPVASAMGMRLPSFCSGCPHSTSTRVPEGSRALAGIGCHGMATIRQIGVTTTMSQMGGEGAMWIGQSPFTAETHVFANVGDGTYFHSGLLAIRAAVAAKVNLTYKVLVNGFVSMTGGQPIEGELSVPSLIQSLHAEGVHPIVVVTDDVGKYSVTALPHGVAVRPRHELDAVQREFRQFNGVSAIVYEQPCATERRRLRKKGEWADPAVRTFIHPDVCEGCGDCGKASDCLSIEPLETPLGRKRRINQSSCNKDRTCVDGFCPSFITVHGGVFRGQALSRTEDVATDVDSRLLTLPEPTVAPMDGPCNVLFAGIGGTGVVTVSTLLAQAAHLQGLAVSALDVTGLSQKYGGVQSHVRLATHSAALPASRIAPGQADVLIGCDVLVSAEVDVEWRLKRGLAQAVLNTGMAPSADFTRNPDWQPQADVALARLQAACSAVATADATALAEQWLGDAIGANLLLLGFALQRGWLPVSRACMEQAIQRQGGSTFNLRALGVGRLLAHDPAYVASASPRAATQLATPSASLPVNGAAAAPASLAEWKAFHLARLQAYGVNAHVRSYEQLVSALAEAERSAGRGEAVTTLAARGYFKVLAHKDEFEVARLLSEPTFLKSLEDQFDGRVDLHVHLGGGGLARADGQGRPRKRELSGLIWTGLRVLASTRGLRDTWLDPWRQSPERTLARQWRAWVASDIQFITQHLTQGVTDEVYQQLLALANISDGLRGYGHVREAQAATASIARKTVLNNLNGLASTSLQQEVAR